MKLAALVVLAPALAAADPDLQVHHEPPKLTMRPKPAKVVAQPTAPGATKSEDNTVDASFSPVPRSFRDLAERVTLHVRAGVDLENAPATSDPLRGGAPLPPNFAESRPWIVGDAMLGARDL